MNCLVSLAPAGNPVTPLSLTYFERNTKPAGQRNTTTWTDLCNWIEWNTLTAATKNDLPLIKLATFAGDYRTDANLEALFGIEGDYDAELMQPSEAMVLLTAKGVQAFIYTSPSHGPDNPRWRVLCPLSRPHAPNEHHALVGRLNGLLGDILAKESFTPSQAYYVGSVTGGHPLQCWRTEGQALDTVEGLPIIAPPRAGGQGVRQFKPGEGRRAPFYQTALDALRSVHPSDTERGAWLSMSGAFFIATFGLPGAENAERDWQTWNEQHGDKNKPDENARTWGDFQRNGADHDFTTLGKMSANDNARGWAFFNGVVHQLPSQPHPRRFFIRVSEMVYRAPEYLVDRLIETDTMSLLFGDPAAGKSFVAIDIACSVATGTDFHDHTAKQGATFYIAGEGRNGLKRRFSAWEEHRGVSLANANLFTSDGVAAQFLDANSAQMVANSVDALATTCGAPRLIVVDTLARNFGGGNENSQEDMGRFIATLDQLKSKYPGCVILIVHHSGHAEKERSRGSSVLKGALDCEFKVTNKDGTITFENTKMKDGPTPRPMEFRLETVGFSAALEYVGEPNGEKRGLSPSLQTALETFNERGSDVVATEDWRVRFYAKRLGSSPDANKKAFNRARERLVEDKYLVTADDGMTYRRAQMPGIMSPRGDG